MIIESIKEATEKDIQKISLQDLGEDSLSEDEISYYLELKEEKGK